MSDYPENHASLTFVVRLWRETDAEGHARWRGRVEHVASQAVGYVEGVAGVARFIERWTGEPATARALKVAVEQFESRLGKERTVTPEEMKAALAKMNDDAWHKRDLDAAYAIYADDIVFQRAPFPPVVGKEANKQADAGTLAAFSDVRSTIDDLLVAGETAVIRWTWEGTHSGTSPSLDIPATGKCVRFVGCSVYYFREGKIVQ